MGYGVMGLWVMGYGLWGFGVMGWIEWLGICVWGKNIGERVLVGGMIRIVIVIVEKDNLN